MNAHLSFGKYLQEARLTQNLSQKDVAEKLGYTSPQFISNWERDISFPPLTAVFVLSKIYSLNSDDIFNHLLKASLEQIRANMINDYNKLKIKNSKK